MTNVHLHINRRRPARLGVFVALLGALAMVTQPLSACTVCYGETENAYLRGAEQATLFLAGVTYAVLLGGVGAFLVLRRRAARRRLAGHEGVAAAQGASPPRPGGA